MAQRSFFFFSVNARNFFGFLLPQSHRESESLLSISSLLPHNLLAYLLRLNNMSSDVNSYVDTRI